MQRSPLILVTTLVLSSFILAACQPPNPTNPDQLTTQNNQPQQSNPTNLKPITEAPMKTLTDFETIEASQAVLNTSKGPITIELFREKAPLTTANFLNLAKAKFYDGIVFHRIVPDFVAQVGDPLTKDKSKEALWGSGGPGYRIADEFGPDLKHDAPGVVSMANSGPNTGGSQFFITFAATPWLDGKHAIFGKVTSGMDVVSKLTVGDKIDSIELK